MIISSKAGHDMWAGPYCGNSSRKNMITIKVKFRESTIKKKKGTIYYLLTRNKEYREITTPYKIHSHEWNDKRSLIAISNAEYQRRYELQLIENSIIRDIRHLQHILTSENNIDTIIFFYFFR